MVRARIYDPETGKSREGGWDLVAAWKASETARLWLDVDTVTEHERRAYLEEGLGLHRLALQDALRDRHPPKTERFDNFLFVMVRGLSADTTDVNFRFIEIALFLTPRLLVTRRTGPSPNTDYLWEAAANNPAQLADPEAVGMALIGRVIRRYLTLLLDLEPRLDAIETEIFTRPSDHLLHELTLYRNRLKALRRNFRYHEQMLAKLISSGGAAPHLKHETEDVYDQTTRGVSLSDFQYEVTSDMVDGYLALSSHRLNQVMRVLTLITVIFVPITFIAGIYGMNFESMPELKSSSGYFVVLGVMGSIVMGLLYFFKRKGWLWSD